MRSSGSAARVFLVFTTMVVSAFFAPETACSRQGDDGWTFHLTTENDAFATGGTDYQYTFGTNLSWVSPGLDDYGEIMPGWTLPAIGILPFVNTPGETKNIAFSLGQKIFTPPDISTTALQINDRPYAGWLYVAMTLHSKNETVLDSLELQLGTTGPWAMGDKMMAAGHNIFDAKDANGWHHQLENEPGLEFLYQRKIMFFELGGYTGPGIDWIGHYGAALGNVEVSANSGLTFRLGWNIPRDFGTNQMRIAGDNAIAMAGGSPGSGSGFHLFVRAQGRAIAWDLFLDGNTFAESHRVDKRHFVGEASAGAIFDSAGLKLSYEFIVQTKEYMNQPKRHKFGVISISYAF